MAYQRREFVDVTSEKKEYIEQHPSEAAFLNSMKNVFPTLTNVVIPVTEDVTSCIVMSMEPRFDGEARQAIHAAIASSLRPKLVIVVNADINVYDPNQITWAMLNRMQPLEDMMVIDSQRDSSSIGIDATNTFGTTVLASEFPELINFQDA